MDIQSVRVNLKTSCVLGAKALPAMPPCRERGRQEPVHERVETIRVPKITVKSIVIAIDYAHESFG